MYTAYEERSFLFPWWMIGLYNSAVLPHSCDRQRLFVCQVLILVKWEGRPFHLCTTSLLGPSTNRPSVPADRPAGLYHVFPKSDLELLVRFKRQKTRQKVMTYSKLLHSHSLLSRW